MSWDKALDREIDTLMIRFDSMIAKKRKQFQPLTLSNNIRKG
jgi:hypothetical protein